MEITYNPLWKLLIDKGLKRTDLLQMAQISSATLAKLGKNESVSTDTLLRICNALNCSLSDIVSSTNSEDKKNNE